MLWRCRRGLLERDIVLAAFVKKHYAQLTAAQLQAFDALLDYPDNQLWDMVTERQPHGDNSTQSVLTLMRNRSLTESRQCNEQAQYPA
jgi:antitoxin CptB